MEPPVSSARPAAAKPPATAVAVPLLLAPGASVRSIALKVGPAQLLLARVLSSLNAGMLVLPRGMTPASSMRSTTTEFWNGNRSIPPACELNGAQPAVDGNPTQSMDSLMTIG